MPFDPSLYTVDPRILATLGMPSASNGAFAGAQMTGHPGTKMSLWDKIQENVAPVPSALKGLLSEDDIKGARNAGLLQAGAAMLQASGPRTDKQSLGQILGQGIAAGQQGYQQNLGGLTKGLMDRQKMAADQQGMIAGQQNIDFNRLKMEGFKQEQARLAQVQQARQQVFQKYGAPDTKDPVGTAKWIDAVIPELVAAGDDDMVGKLSEIRKSLGAGAKRNLIQRNLGDHNQLVDEQTGEVVADDKVGITPGQQASLSLRETMTPVQQARLEGGILTRFAGDTKDYVKAHEAWSQVEGVVKRVEAGAHSPDDVVQLLDGISRLNNPGAVVRTSTVQMQLDKIGDLAQKAQMKYGQATNGMWPKEIVQGIARAAHAIADEHEKQYHDLRKRAAKRGEKIGLPAEYLDQILPDTWDGYTRGPAFGVPGQDLSGYNFGGGQ